MIFKTVLYLHIVAGTIALTTGLLAILFRSNVKKHRPVGKIYYWAMTVIFVTSVAMSIMHQNIFLFCVSFFTYYSTLIARRSLHLKKLHIDQSPKKIDWIIEGVFGIMHFLFVLFGIWLLIKGHITPAIICLVFGLIGINGNIGSIKRLRKINLKKNYWLTTHVGHMLGSYIGAITAFTVNNSKWIPAPDLVLWLGPTVLIAPFLAFQVRKFSK